MLSFSKLEKIPIYSVKEGQKSLYTAIFIFVHKQMYFYPNTHPLPRGSKTLKFGNLDPWV